MKPKTEEKSPPGDKEKAQVDSDQEMLNLDKEIYSLTHYADDEEELVAHMFATIKGSKLEAMMPPILKEIPLIDVQQLCLHELRGMSQRRILSIINGQEMSGSSSDEDSDEDKKPPKIQDENEEFNVEEKLTEENIADFDNVNESNLTALDLLELEMRAKLIKTMLEKQEGDEGREEDEEEKGIGNGFVPDIKIKEEPLTPESTHMEEEDRQSPTTKRQRKKYSRHRRSGSRSYSSSYSGSSRSSSYSSSSRSRSGSRSRSSSNERKRDGSGSPDSRRPTKKKITKKEFEARMKKARMNRSYRKRKDSEDDSGGDKKKTKGKSKKKEAKTGSSSYSLKKTLIESNIVPPPPEEEEESCSKEVPEELEEGEEGEEGAAEEKEGEVTEKEEGEIDSNEEGALSSSGSRSRSRSYSSGSYSSYSSRSRSYSRSPSRRRSSRRRHRKSSKYRRRNRSSRSPSVPKVPNWPQPVVKISPTPDDITKTDDTEQKPETDSTAAEETLPGKEDRQSISFSFSKKSSAPIKSNPELNDDGLPNTSVASYTKENETNEEENVSSPMDVSSPVLEDSVEYKMDKKTSEESKPKVNDGESGPSKEGTLKKSKSKAKLPEGRGEPSKEESKVNEQQEEAEVMEDFYKGADQLSFSEEEAGECEEEADLETFLHDDTPVEPIHVGDATLRKSVKVVANKDEPPIVSWEKKKKKDRMKGDLVIEGVGFLKSVLSEAPGDSPVAGEDSNDILLKDQPTPEDASQMESLADTLEESSQDVLETLPELEVDDSQESHSLDIIGVIDPKDTESKEEMFDEGGGSSWSMRWLQSEKVQKVVSNSKMLSKVRKNIQAKGKASVKERPKVTVKTPSPVEPPKPVPETPVVKKIEIKPPSSRSGSNVIGSIEEYEKLFGIKVKAPTSLPQPKPAPKMSVPAGLLDSDDDEDSEEEALWSKIIKKE